MLATSTTTQPQPVRIVIADDHPCMIDGIRFALRKFKHIQIVGDALNGVELIETVAQQLPDVVFTDIEMPLMNGIEAGKEIHQRFPHIKLIAFTAFDASHYITEMMIGAKASGYLLKGADHNEMLKAINKVMSNEIYCSELVSAKVFKLMQQTETNAMKPFVKPVFTEKQLIVLKGNAEQLTSKEIAAKHNLPVKSVESIRKKLLKKIGVRNSVGLALYTARHIFKNL